MEMRMKATVSRALESCILVLNTTDKVGLLKDYCVIFDALQQNVEPFVKQ